MFNNASMHYSELRNENVKILFKAIMKKPNDGDFIQKRKFYYFLKSLCLIYNLSSLWGGRNLVEPSL